MNYALILAGGTGSRLGTAVPKQYLKVGGKPVLTYSLTVFDRCDEIDGIVVIAADKWMDTVQSMARRAGIRKLLGVAPAGATRMESVRSGMVWLDRLRPEEEDVVLIHDGARPLVTEMLIRNALRFLEGADGSLPVIPIKESVYISQDTEAAGGYLERDGLYIGQSPEAYRLKQYQNACMQASSAELARYHGSSELALAFGMRIRTFQGDERNLKLDTEWTLQLLQFLIKKVPS